MTNRERMNALPDAELASFFCDVMERIADKVDSDHDDLCTICPVRKLCYKGHNGFLAWLTAEVEEEKPKRSLWYQ